MTSIEITAERCTGGVSIGDIVLAALFGHRIENGAAESTDGASTKIFEF